MNRSKHHPIAQVVTDDGFFTQVRYTSSHLPVYLAVQFVAGRCSNYGVRRHRGCETQELTHFQLHSYNSKTLRVYSKPRL